MPHQRRDRVIFGAFVVFFVACLGLWLIGQTASEDDIATAVERFVRGLGG